MTITLPTDTTKERLLRWVDTNIKPTAEEHAELRKARDAAEVLQTVLRMRPDVQIEWK